MAEGDTGEKTEDATPKKLQDAREEGQVAKSQELPAVFVLLAAVLSLKASAPLIYEQMARVMVDSLAFEGVPPVTDLYCLNLFIRYLQSYAITLMPVLAAVFFAALAINFFQVGFFLTSKALMPKLSNLNPIKGFAQKFSVRSVMELVKSVLKIAIIGGITWAVVEGEMTRILLLYDTSIGSILLYLMAVVYKIFIRVCLVMILLALLDFGFQKWKFSEDQKMTKQEVKDEHKQTEGDPQVKARIRQLQMEAARSRMMAEVPEAEVVVTNPTHLAVAIKYVAGEMSAPQIVAKGAGPIALRIREIAEEHDVPVVEDKPLAQSLYKMADIGDDVPGELYVAVAELLAYVYNLKGKTL